MSDEVPSSNTPDLLMPTKGAYVWHLEDIVVAVRIDHVSCKYETGLVVDSATDKDNNNNNTSPIVDDKDENDGGQRLHKKKQGAQRAKS
jgi:hypothetical protein